MDRLASFTLDMCDRFCSDQRPYRCCDKVYCLLALDYAKEVGEPLTPTDHPELPLMGPDNRCTAPAHLRPLCAAHHCDLAALGVFRPRPGFPPKEALRATRTYFRLRAEAEGGLDAKPSL